MYWVKDRRVHINTKISTILERAVSQSDDDFITMTMRPIHRDAIQVKGGRGAPRRRADFVESAVTKRDGIWIQVHDAIEDAFDELFKQTENEMVEIFGEVFDALRKNFCLLCDDSKTKDDKEKVLEKVLRDNLKEKAAEVKGMLEEDGKIAELVAACKAFHSSQAATDTSSLFVPR